MKAYISPTTNYLQAECAYLMALSISTKIEDSAATEAARVKEFEWGRDSEGRDDSEDWW